MASMRHKWHAPGPYLANFDQIFAQFVLDHIYSLKLDPLYIYTNY